MAGDAATLNALKDIAKSIQDQNRTLKSLDDHVAKLAKALSALNNNYVEIHRDSSTAVTNDEES